MEDGQVLEGKGPGRQQAPPWMRSDDFDGRVEVRLVIGPEKQAAPLPCPGCQQVEKPGLQEPVLVMALFRPWIGEKQVHIEQPRTGGQFLKEIVGVAA